MFSLSAMASSAVPLLQSYIRIDTTNPPGHEMQAAQFWKRFFTSKGIEVKIFDMGHDRANVLARVRGTGVKRPMILLNHLDVVPAVASAWRRPPFSGAILDGEIYGRGAIDMKATAVAQALTLVAAKQEKWPLQRDLIFLGTADEEVGTQSGALWMLKHHLDALSGAEFLLTEGEVIAADPDKKSNTWKVAVVEKGRLEITLKSHGAAGHASIPDPESAPNRLVRALDKLRRFEADHKGDPEQRTTLSLTVLQASERSNTVASVATAVLDSRLLPSADPKAYLEEIRKVIDDANVDLVVTEEPILGKASPINTELYRAIDKARQQFDASATLVPTTLVSTTDAVFFRQKGIVAYGFEPFVIKAGSDGEGHTDNERVGINNFERSIEILKTIMKTVTK